MSAASSAATGGSISSIENDDISISSSKFGAEVGFIFDASLPSKPRSFTFSPEVKDSSLKRDVHIKMECVDDDPGAVQSGHYLWPASPALARYLVETYGGGKPDAAQVSRVLELGAGCGLPALTALQVFRDAQCVVMTDYDPGCLSRAKHNYESTLSYLRKIETEQSLQEDDTDQKNMFSLPAVSFEELRWGDEERAKSIIDEVKNRDFDDDLSGKFEASDEKGASIDGFDLILGSDLIYSDDVIRPLLESVYHLLSKSKSSLMIMAQSFPYEESAESVFDEACQDLGLFRSQIVNNLEEEGGVRIQKIEFKASND